MNRQIKLPLNLSTLSDTWRKFISANRSRLAIVLLPLGTAGRHGNDERRSFKRNEKPAWNLLQREAVVPFAPFFSARARNALGSVLPPFAHRRRRARAFLLLSVGARIARSAATSTDSKLQP